jgi:transposase-like protein
MSDKVICPWCNWEDDIWITQKDKEVYDCPECGKQFSVDVEVLFNYNTNKVEVSEIEVDPNIL